ncbi:unnamed protein product, partial [Mesorhabditis belari]|uniref:BZIP domain-containing protein n=1 Tax=Mesorhabditis belari TaxID=2138241 RepID=A0AAF3J1Q2_9BILA
MRNCQTLQRACAWSGPPAAFVSSQFFREYLTPSLTEQWSSLPSPQFPLSPIPCIEMALDEPFRQMAEGSPEPMWCHLSTSSSLGSTPSSPMAPIADAPCLLAETSLDLNEAPWNLNVQSPKKYCSETRYYLPCNNQATLNQTLANQNQEEPCTIVTVHSAPSTTAVFSPCPPPTAHRSLASNLPDNPVTCDLVVLNRTATTVPSLLVPQTHRRPRKMEWQNLDSEDLFFDEHQPFPDDFPLPDGLIEHFADEMPNIHELENYLYPSGSTNPVNLLPAKQNPAHSCQPSTSAINQSTVDSFGEYMDPLAEFFPDLANANMPPHTTNPEQNFGVYGDSYPQHQFDFLETPQSLDQYCKRESGSCSPISVGSPEGSQSPSSSGGPIRSRTAIVRVSTPPYVAVDLGPVTDYRQKRDKNNVASARSRQKRQDKFSQMKKECSDLEMRNVELRATLNTLEKSVQEYKNIMLAFMNKP